MDRVSMYSIYFRKVTLWNKTGLNGHFFLPSSLQVVPCGLYDHIWDIWYQLPFTVICRIPQSHDCNLEHFFADFQHLLLVSNKKRSLWKTSSLNDCRKYGCKIIVTLNNSHNLNSTLNYSHKCTTFKGINPVLPSKG